MNLPEFSVKNHFLGNMLTIIVLVLGIVAAFNMRREFFPATDLDIVVVFTLYPNASPEEVEKLITTPLEDEIRGIDGIEKFISTSVENSSTIVITIDPDAPHKERIINDISRRVDRVRDLPEGAEKPDVQPIVIEDTVIHACVGGNLPGEDIRAYAEKLEARMENVNHVASIRRTGWRSREMVVEIDPRALRDREISIFDVVGALERRNINMPGGTLPQDTRELILRTMGRFETAEDIEEVIVRSNADGRHVLVRDVATVKEALSEEEEFLRINGSRGVMMSVIKKSSGDTVEVADAIEELIEKERKHLPAGIELSVIDFESYVIKRRLKVVFGNGLLGLLLVLLCLPLLMNFRVAFVTALGIPFAFLTTILVMSFFGISINMLTMFGIILVIGMLVDDAIIMAENIFRHMESGKNVKEAAIAGASEVMWPVTATVLTTIAAFLPLAFLPGIIGTFFKWIPIVVIITLGASLFEALLILPCHVMGLAKPIRKTNTEGNGRQREGIGSRWSSFLQAKYTVLLTKVLRHRAGFVAAVVCSFLASVLVAVTVMDVDMFPPDLVDIFFVKISAPPGTSQAETERIVTAVERAVMENTAQGDVRNIQTEMGYIRDYHGSEFTRGSQYALLTVFLSPAQERPKDRSAQKIIEALQLSCPQLDGTEISFEMLKPGPPSGKPVDIEIVGKDLETLDEIAEKAKGVLAELEGVTNVTDSYAPGKEELRIVVDRKEAARLGLDVQSIGSSVYSAFQGIEATTIRTGDEEIRVLVRLAEPYRSEVGSLKDLRIRNNGGRLIELDRVMLLERRSGVSGIRHFDGKRSVRVTADLIEPDPNRPLVERIRDFFARIADLVRGKRPVSVSSVNKAVTSEFEALSDYPGYRMFRGGEWETQSETMRGMALALTIALVLIYAILVVQFRSFSQPLVVLVAIPFGLIGVVLALVVHLKPISMMAMLGMVGMCGVVVNDAIVLVSFVNDLRRKGVPPHEAIVQGARMRLRPILLTSFTTVLGLAPVIYGLGGYEPFVAPAAIVLAYGLVFATFLTLLVVPCMYSLGIDGAQKRAEKRRREPL